MPEAGAPLGLFEGYGVELEYMIVKQDTLDVFPIADRLLAREAGETVTEVEHEDINWSNELALHVVEFKTAGPAGSLAGLSARFHQHVSRALAHLEAEGAVLLPGAAHPWMDPLTEAVLWPHEYNKVYQAFNRIFDCRGHGWTNLQSAHLNLPFADDEEFGRLHAAIRLVLPLLPALAASSPVLDGRVTGLADARLEEYRHHCDRIPSLVAGVIPEPVFESEGYQREVLEPLYRDLAPHDPEGILQFEWANARGAIARFDRNTIEIRVVDVQECPAADLAIAAAATALIRLLVAEHRSSQRSQRAVASDTLRAVLIDTIRLGDLANVENREYLAALGFDGSGLNVADLWDSSLDRAASAGYLVEECAPALETILGQGALARRILRHSGPEPSPSGLRETYQRLVQALAANELFTP